MKRKILRMIVSAIAAALHTVVSAIEEWLLEALEDPPE